MPRLISTFVGGDMSTAAEYGGWLIFAYAFMQFIFAPVLGNLSDKYGRRPVLLISLFTLGIDCLFMAYAPTLFWLFIGRIIGGMTGGSHSVASAYIADISEDKDRAKNFSLLNAAFGVGFIIGPVMGGLLVRWGLHVPFLVAAGLSFLNVLYGYFILPESLAKDKRRSFSWKRSNPIGAFIQLKKFPIIIGLLTAYTFVYIAGHSMESVWAYYVIEKLGWGEDMIGYSLGFMGVSIALVQGVLCGIILPKLGDKRAVYIGLTVEIIAFLLFAFINQGWMAFAVSAMFAISGIGSPALQAIVSKQVPLSEQGELQGGISSLISATAIIGPPMMTTIFALCTAKGSIIYFPGMPFVFSALLITIGLGLTIKALRKY